MANELQKDSVKELTKIAQSYRKSHPNSEEGYQMEALFYKELGMTDKQKEILNKALEQSFAAPRCAVMLADIEFREQRYDKSLQNFKKAIAESNKMKTAVHNGYLYVMTALCKIARAKQNNAELSKAEILDIYGDFDIALSYSDSLNANYREILAKKTNYLLDKYNVAVPDKDTELQKFIKELNKENLKHNRRGRH